MPRLTRICLVATVTAAVLMPSAAGATQPEMFRSHDVFDVNFGDGICGFPLLAHVDATNIFKVFLDRHGEPVRGILTGPISVWFTNGDTGETRRLSISGPTFMDADGRSVRGTGSWATFTVDGDFVWAAGNMELDEVGTILSLRGRARPICRLVS